MNQYRESVDYFFDIEQTTPSIFAKVGNLNQAIDNYCQNWIPSMEYYLVHGFEELRREHILQKHDAKTLVALGRFGLNADSDPDYINLVLNPRPAPEKS